MVWDIRFVEICLNEGENVRIIYYFVGMMFSLFNATTAVLTRHSHRTDVIRVILEVHLQYYQNEVHLSNFSWELIVLISFYYYFVPKSSR